jgi:hypothetical protein
MITTKNITTGIRSKSPIGSGKILTTNSYNETIISTTEFPNKNLSKLPDLKNLINAKSNNNNTSPLNSNVNSSNNSVNLLNGSTNFNLNGNANNNNINLNYQLRVKSKRMNTSNSKYFPGNENRIWRI